MLTKVFISDYHIREHDTRRARICRLCRLWNSREKPQLLDTICHCLRLGNRQTANSGRGYLGIGMRKDVDGWIDWNVVRSRLEVPQMDHAQHA